MINELHALSETLARMKIETKRWHKDYMVLPAVSKTEPCIRLWISQDGAIASASFLEKDAALVVRKYGNKQATFPAFNICALYEVTDEEQKAQIKAFQDGKCPVDVALIKAWCTPEARLQNKTGIDARMKGSLKKARALQDCIKKARLEDKNSVTKLISAIGIYESSSFREALERCIFNQLESADDAKPYLQLLFQTETSDKPKNRSIVLDWKDLDSDNPPIAHEKTTDWVNKVLLACNAAPTAALADGQDAFGNEYEYSKKSVSMPKENLSVLGEVTLRSMYKKQPCQHRYHTSEDGSYPISAANRAAAKSALGWLAQPQHRDITWQAINGNGQEVLFAYPSAFSETPPNMVQLLGSENLESRFLEAAKKMAATLEALSPEEKPDNIQIFIIKKMDKARSKVIYSRNCTPEWLLDAAEHWQAGCENIPTLDVRVFPLEEKGTAASTKVPILQQALTPYPLQVEGIINNVWKRNGTLPKSTAGVQRMKAHQGIELLLEPAAKTTLENYLHTLLAHASGLVLYTGNQQHRNRAYSSKEKKELAIQGREIALQFSLLGLLLYKCNCKKGDYMENTAFLVGQLLKISDELHALYCEIVRKGSIPPQLAGNAVFVSASETPIQALAVLSTRMQPYLAWAKQYRTKKEGDSWRANWLLSLYEKTASSLAPLLSGTIRFADLEKAQVFIGYLAAFPKKESDAQPLAAAYNSINEGEH